MSSKVQDWPTIAISKDDQVIVKEIARFPGVLQSAEAKSILMIAAAMAVELDLDLSVSTKASSEGGKADIIHSGLLRSPSYHEYRQYMLLIFYLTAGQHSLKNMNDFKAIADNFVKLAHDGLRYLKIEYLKPNGSEKLEELFGEYISKYTTSSLT